jgi:crotonobetainyl-CoA:carnitine CoA-transferase CaiB-like acyl-CoA transferase
MDDPQVRHLGMVVEAEDPEVGPIELMGPAYFFRGSPGQFPGVAPAAGRDSDEILAGIGYSSEDIGRARREGVLPS